MIGEELTRKEVNIYMERRMKKFELTTDFITVHGVKLFRIKSLVEFGAVKAGELGGYIEKEENLDQSGDAWVSGNAWVCGNARVSGDTDYTTVHGFGSEYRTTTFYRQKDDSIGVKCGCFDGNLDEFRAKVKETHGNTKCAKEYLMIADLMELHFSRENANIGAEKKLK